MDPLDLAKGVQPIKAYQGGPHRVGEEGYQNDKIGTGEGAQAYGYGHYFAEHEPIAKSYRDKLTTSEDFVDSEPMDTYNPKHYLSYILSQHSGSSNPTEDVLEHLNDTAFYGNSKSIKETAKKALDLFHSGERPKKESVKPQGYMHEVAIHAHPDHFLDWDKPLSEQSNHTKQKIKDLMSGDLFNMDFDNATGWQKLPGGKFYEALRERIGSIKSSAADASKSLHQHGIRGIRYLDAGSRGENAQPTHNYVVFDPKDIEITRRYEKGGFVRRAYKKGGKVEGAIWHDRDAFDDGGSTGDPRGAAEARGMSSSTGSEDHETSAPEQHDAEPNNPQGEFGRTPDQGFNTEAAKLFGEGQVPSWAGTNYLKNESATNALELGHSAAAAAASAKLNAASNAAEAAAGQSASGAADAAMSSAFGQPPLPGGSFIGASNPPQHYESTLESNLVEPAWTPIAPNADLSQGIPGPMQPAPNANIFQATPGLMQPAPNTNVFQATPGPMQPAPNTNIFQATPGITQPTLDGNSAARQYRDSITQNMGAEPQASPVSQMPANVPLPPIDPRDYEPHNLLESSINNLAGLFGGSQQQLIDKFNQKNLDAGMSPEAAFSKAQYDMLGVQNQPPREGHGGSDAQMGGKPQGNMIQKRMPDGSMQWVYEDTGTPYKKGGKVYRKLINSGIVDHVITKFGAKLPASNQKSTGDTAGRRR